jgi:hypothetical protein
MTQPDVKESMSQRNRRFHWETFLPKRKAWIQTLILLPFGGSVANFLVISWHFSVNSIGEEHQYPIGIISMVINLLLPSLFFGFLWHWGWLMWRQVSPTWYPQMKGLGAGCYATLTIAVSFGIVGLFTQSLGVCGNPDWGSVSQNLLCNLDGYGFESKSWFGAWFIIAAYCYQALDSILAWRNSGSSTLHRHHYSQQFSFDETPPANDADFTSMAIVHDDLASHDDLTSIAIDIVTADAED